MYMYVAFHTVLGEYESGDHFIFTGVLATYFAYIHVLEIQCTYTGCRWGKTYICMSAYFGGCRHYCAIPI